MGVLASRITFSGYPSGWVLKVTNLYEMTTMKKAIHKEDSKQPTLRVGGVRARLSILFIRLQDLMWCLLDSILIGRGEKPTLLTYLLAIAWIEVVIYCVLFVLREFLGYNS